MSQEPVDKPSSGVRPEEVRKPTIIRGGSAPSPARAPQTHKPTVISTPPAAAVTQTPKPTPTIIKPPPVPPASARPPVVTRPSAVAGVVRKGIDVALSALAEFSPGTPMEVLQEAVATMQGVILDLMTESQGARWGEESQRQFEQLTEKSLELLSARAVQDGTAHLTRLQTLLGELSATFQNGSSKGFLGGFGKHVDPWERFQEIEPELRQVRRLLETVIPAIIKVDEDFRSSATKFKELTVVLDAKSLAARYMAEKLLGSTKARLSQSLLERSASLTKTVALLQQGSVVRDQMANDFRQLVSLIQEGVLNTLPAWVESVTMLSKRESKTQTDVYTFQQGLRNVLQQIKRG